MGLKRKFLKGGATIALAQIAGQVCSLGRNVIIARLVSQTDFGIAAIFVMVVSFLQMTTNLSLNRLLVQAPDGNSVEFQKVGHFLQMIRGIICCIILLALAVPIANLFSIPETRNAFFVLAFIPLLNGFNHLDPRRWERDLRYWPNASIELASQVISLALAWPMGKWFGNYWAMLYLLLIKTTIMVIGSHLVAERKYGWSRNQEFVHRFISFGWPLLINGLLIFGIFQGDRFILGAAKKMFGAGYGMADVGLYSAAFMITMIPAMMCRGAFALLTLPVLSKEQNSPQMFYNKAILFLQGLTVMALAFGVFMLLAGDKIIPFIYGEKYNVTWPLMAWLSIFWTIGIMRGFPTNVAMALGNTIVLMQANIIRIISLIGIVFVVFYELNIAWVAAVGAAGELLAYFSSLLLNKFRLSIPLSMSFRPSAVLAGFLLSATIFHLTILQKTDGILWCFYVLLVSLSLPLAAVFLFPEFRKKLTSNRKHIWAIK